MEQKNKEILDELVALLKQLKKDKIAGAPYISRFFNYWLNAKPCGILDFAHTTHGLNP